MNPRLRRLFAAVIGKGGGAATPYSSILINDYGATEVWPLVDIASGTTITAKVNAARNGTLSGWTLQNAAGPVTGTLAPSLNGSTGDGSLNTLSLQAAFNGALGWMTIYGKVSAVGDWTDGTLRQLLDIKVDNNNRYAIYKGTVNNAIDCYMLAGGTGAARRITTSITDWFHVLISWNGTTGKVYFNATPQAGVTLGTFTGAPSIYRIAVASTNTSVWKGWMAYAAMGFGAVPSDADVAAMYAARLGAGPENP